MGKLHKLCIEFESKDDVYHAGQSVIGAALIELSESMDVRGEWRACGGVCRELELGLTQWCFGGVYGDCSF